MPDDPELSALRSAIPIVRERIAKYRSSKDFNEQNTKASLIIPVLQALGWDTNDPDEVHWEYKPKPKYNPVDFALLLQRTPCLLVEAKALRDPLRDDKLLNQIFSYASVAGVQWVALTNGDEYQVYNAAVPVPAEEKLFRSVSVSRDKQEVVLGTLSLLSKPNLQEKKIGRLWEAHFVDRQVKGALEELLNSADPKPAIVAAVKKFTADRLSTSAIRHSLRRVRLTVDFPAEPDQVPTNTRAVAEPPPVPAAPSARAGAPKRRSDDSVTVRDLLSCGLLPTGAKLVSTYQGHELIATVDAAGRILYGGEAFNSPSLAAGTARKPYYTGGAPAGQVPATNGWTFWRAVVNGQPIPLDELRRRLLERGMAPR